MSTNTPTIAQLTLHYAGAVSLLAECAAYLGNRGEHNDLRDSIERAVQDWCDLSGWRYEKFLHRIELIPPSAFEDGDNG